MRRYNKTNSNWCHWSLVEIFFPQLGNITVSLLPRITFPNFGKTIFTIDLSASHCLYNVVCCFCVVYDMCGRCSINFCCGCILRQVGLQVKRSAVLHMFVLLTYITNRITLIFFHSSCSKLPFDECTSVAVLLSLLQEYRKLQVRIEQLERLLDEHGINRTALTDQWYIDIIRDSIDIDQITSPVCPHCGTGEETAEHLLLFCPKWAAERQRYFGDSIKIRDVFHDCENATEFLISSGHLPPPIQAPSDGLITHFSTSSPG